MGILEAIENSGVGVWVRESPSMFAYTGFLALHGIGLAFAVGFSWLVALRTLGLAAQLPFSAVSQVFPVIWFGFTVNVLSGVPLLISNAVGDLTSPIFLTKLTLVVGAAATTWRLQQSVFTESAGRRAGDAAQGSAGLASAVIVLWAAAMFAGRMAEYPTLLGFNLE